MEKAQEIGEEVEVDVAASGTDTDVELGEDGEPIAKVEEELDEDGKPVVKAKPVESWQLTGDEEVDKDELPDVPVDTHIKMKSKLKGRIKDRDEELDRIKEELATLKSSGGATATDLPPRPKAEDFDSDGDYDEAFEKWDDQRLSVKLNAEKESRQKVEATKQYKEKVAKAVDEHYDRQAELVADSGMKAEYFKEADTAVREMVDTVLPNQGDAITDHVITLLGKGSEKVMFFIGRNKAARLEFQNLLAEDKTGMKAMVYLGQQKERLNNPKKVTSKAPKPAADASGDVTSSPKEAALKAKYTKAHAAGKTQEAYNIKKQGKKAKYDTGSW